MKERNAQIDFLKGMGIVLMVMGHVGFGKCFDAVIHAFHIPLFFIISGMLFRSTSSIRKRALRLLPPYMIFVVINIFVCLLQGVVDIKWFANAILLPTDSVAGAAWFLPILFFAQAILLLEYRVLKSERLIGVISFALLLVALYLPNNILFGLRTILIAQAYLMVGKMLSKHRDVIEPIRCWGGIITLSAVAICAKFNGFANMRTGEFGRMPLLYPLTSTLIVISLLIIVDQLKISNNFVSFLGQHSITFMGFNQNFILLNKILIENVFHSSGVIGVLLLRMVIFSLTMVECGLIVVLLKKYRIEVLT